MHGFDAKARKVGPVSANTRLLIGREFAPRKPGAMQYLEDRSIEMSGAYDFAGTLGKPLCQ
jgi:hypothetical protein